MEIQPVILRENKPHLVALKRTLEPMLRQEGVRYHGMVSEAELARAYAFSGFYAYPTDKSETGVAYQIFSIPGFWHTIFLPYLVRSK